MKWEGGSRLSDFLKKNGKVCILLGGLGFGHWTLLSVLIYTVQVVCI